MGSPQECCSPCSPWIGTSPRTSSKWNILWEEKKKESKPANSWWNPPVSFSLASLSPELQPWGSQDIPEGQSIPALPKSGAMPSWRKPLHPQRRNSTSPDWDGWMVCACQGQKEESCPGIQGMTLHVLSQENQPRDFVKPWDRWRAVPSGTSILDFGAFQECRKLSFLQNCVLCAQA